MFRYSWDYFEPFINNRISRAALLIPLVGYLILFSDLVAENLGFTELVSQEDTTYFLADNVRLKFVYFGMIFVALDALFYRITRPVVISQGKNLPQYMDFALTYFTVTDFTNIYKSSALVVWGPDNKGHWLSFLDDASWPNKVGQAPATPNQKRISEAKVSNHSFSAAKKTHENLLREILIKHYEYEASTRKKRLTLCVGLSSLGYLLLLIPSFDLFLRVVEVTFFQSTTTV